MDIRYDKKIFVTHLDKINMLVDLICYWTFFCNSGLRGNKKTWLTNVVLLCSTGSGDPEGSWASDQWSLDGQLAISFVYLWTIFNHQNHIFTSNENPSCTEGHKKIKQTVVFFPFFFLLLFLLAFDWARGSSFMLAGGVVGVVTSSSSSPSSSSCLGGESCREMIFSRVVST